MNFSIEGEEEIDGRWIAEEVPQLPGVLCYGQSADEAMAKAEVLAYVPWLSDSNTASPVPSKPRFPFPSPHESVTFHQGQTLACRALAIGWKVKGQSGSHRTLSREGWADVVFAFHDGEEVGPRMLARIAKHTGLTPEDL